MKRETVSLRSLHDGLRLYATVTIPETEIKGIVQVIHGFMECRELYDELATVLASYGYVVLVADQRGHGQSVDQEHPFGYFANKNGWIINLKDNNRFVKWIRERYRHQPFYLLGHGMGSLIARAYVKRYEYEVDGLILSNSIPYSLTMPITKTVIDTLISDKNRLSPANSLLNTLFSNFNFKVKEKNSYAWLSRNTEVQDLYRNHPLCHGIITYGLMKDIVFGFQDVYVNDDWHPLKKNLPVLFLSGEDDACIDYPKGIDNAIKRLQKIGYQNIVSISFANSRHLLFLDDEKEYVFSDLLSWLNKE